MIAFQDVPLEIRLQVYKQLCRSTTIIVHDATDAKDCGFDGAYTFTTIRGPIALLCSSKSIKKEFEPIFWSKTSFLAHYEPGGCLNRLCFPDEPRVRFFQAVEERTLSEFLDRENIQLSIFNSKDTLPSHHSFLNLESRRFTVTSPLGCSRYAPEWSYELWRLYRLIQYCRGRVDVLEFWWHPAKWEPPEAAVPWHVSVDKSCNFVIKGPTLEGFLALERKFRWMMAIGTDRGSIRQTAVPHEDFKFVQCDTDPMPEHSMLCGAQARRTYFKKCNCGPPSCYGGITDEEKEGWA